MTMDIQNEKNNIFNFKLAKLIGLYQILDPLTVKYRGQNIHHIVIMCFLLYMCLISITMNLSGLYNFTVNMPMSLDYLFRSMNTFYIIYKIWIVIHQSDDVWNCLSITRYSFTSFGNRYRHILDRWRERLVWLTNAYAIFYFISMIGAVAITSVFSDDTSKFKNYDGSVGYYRQNVINLYFVVSDERYNSHYYAFYFVEALFIVMILILFIISDILLVTLCFGMKCQMQIICTAFASAGHNSHSLIDNQSESTKMQPNEHNLIYDELHTIIIDHQAVMGKYEDLLNLFRKAMLLQMFVSSLSVIALCFTFTMGFSNDDRFTASNCILKNTCCAIPPVLFQIFMTCYLFGNINNQKDSIIFALYSSNWTEMDMKCKKFLLFTMKLNNSNHKKLKFTTTKIVNLEMFFKTMSDCYTVISVLVNYIQKKI